MKTARIIIISILLSAGMLSCSDFLDELPTSKKTAEQMFIPEDVQDVQLAVDGLYTAWRASKQGREGFVLQMCGLDETKQGMVQMLDANQSALDNYDGALNSASPQIASIWFLRWPMINTAGRVIYALGLLEQGETDTKKLAEINLLRAHARFTRALAMFETTMYWGEIPVIEYADLNSIIPMDRKPLSEVWKQIVDDLTYAAENLEEGKQTGPRARRGAAIAMLGKACMYAPEASGYRDFAKAAAEFAKLDAIYALESDYGKLFDEWGWMNWNSVESIFEIDYDPNDAGRNGWMWDLGSRTMADKRGRWDANNSTWNNGEGCYMGGYEVALPTKWAYRMDGDSGVWEPGDLRRAESIREDYTYNGAPKPDQVAWMADELQPHVKKWEDRRIDQFATAEQAVEATGGRSMYRAGLNYAYLRYGDILLCRAECLSETGKADEAAALVNRVRTRAWGGILPASEQWSALSKEEFRKQIMDERIRELFAEGWRRMDLIRTGMFVELIKERNPWAAKKGLIKEHHMRWPIPDREINNNSYMDPTKDQNPGY